MKHAKKAALLAVVAIAAPVTSKWEGLRLKAYLDPIGIATICHGETLDVQMGDVKTKAECDALFDARLLYFAERVDWTIDRPMHPKTHAAFTSIAYNIGSQAFARSSMHTLYDAGKYREACKFMHRYKYAGGKVFQGLVNRRKDEVALCLEGVNELEQIPSADSRSGWLSRIAGRIASLFI